MTRRHGGLTAALPECSGGDDAGLGFATSADDLLASLSSPKLEGRHNKNGSSCLRSAAVCTLCLPIADLIASRNSLCKSPSSDIVAETTHYKILQEGKQSAKANLNLQCIDTHVNTHRHMGTHCG